MMRPLAAAALVLCLLLTACSSLGRDDSGDEDAGEAGGGTASGVSGTQDGTLTTADGRERTYHVFVPPTLATGVQVPLLLALHGGTGWGTQFERTTGFDGLAETNDFIVVYPDGVGTGPSGQILRTWNGGYCCGRAARDDVDDVAFLRVLVATLSSRYPVDPDRVYAVGHSNGGIMAYRLACEMADVVSAVAVQSASLGVDSCDPARPVSLMHVHGTADRNHPIDGGEGSQAISGVTFRPAIDGVRAVAAADGCPAGGTTTVRTDNPDVTTTVFSPCGDGTEVRFDVVAGASHAWMGHPARASADPPYLAYDSSAETWAFLAAHPRSGEGQGGG